MEAASISQSSNARFVQYLQPGERLDLAPVQRIANELCVPLAYLFADSDLLAQMVLAFGLLSEREQRKALARIKHEIFSPKASSG